MPHTATHTTQDSHHHSHSAMHSRKKQRLTMNETYFFAHSAQGKLSREASRANHDLRMIVGHANMLDHIMIDIAAAEKERQMQADKWFDEWSSDVTLEDEAEASHIETIEEEEEPEEMNWQTRNNSASSFWDVDIDTDDEDSGSLTLTRTSSRKSPPELFLDDSDTDEEPTPLVTPNPSTDNLLALQSRPRSGSSKKSSKKNQQCAKQLDKYGFYLPSR